ncbi:MAG: hypothetical protein WC479_08550 [Candidatus Izemoplasmatales bacterium]
MKVALVNGLWVKGGPISFSRCIYQTLKESTVIDADLFYWKSHTPGIEGGRSLSNLTPERIAEYLNQNYDMVWLLFAGFRKKHLFKDKTPTYRVLELLKIPFVVTIHREDELETGFYGWTEQERQQTQLPMFHGFMTISKGITLKAIETFGRVNVYQFPLVYPDAPSFNTTRELSIVSTARVDTDKRQSVLFHLSWFLLHCKFDIYGFVKPKNWHGPYGIENLMLYGSDSRLHPPFETGEVWDKIKNALVGADFDTQTIGEKLQGVTIEYMLAGVVPLVIEREDGSRWPTLVDNVNCLKIYENELDKLSIAARRVWQKMMNPDLMDSIRENNYALVEKHRPKAVIPILERHLEKINGR